MASLSTPTTMRAWQYLSTKGGMEKNVKINASALLPKPKPNQHLVKIISTSLNPVDYKPMEVQFLHAIAGPKPATPGVDFVGRIVKPATGSSLQPGQLVFGAAGTTPFAGGALAQYATCPSTTTAIVPEGVSNTIVSTVGVAGVTAYQSIVPFVKGDKSSVFINGGSGGVGSFGIQIAKALGCYVATACSTANVDLCKQLGADLVIDYKKHNVTDALIASGRSFDHIFDTVGSDGDIYFRAHKYSRPGTVFAEVGASITPSGIWLITKMMLLPSFLGGGQRKLKMIVADIKTADLEQIGEWIRTGQVKPLVDSEYPFEELPKAIGRSKTSRAKGKIIVHVEKEATAST